MAHSLRLIEDRLPAGTVAPPATVPRVLFAREGALVAEGGGEAAAVGPGTAEARVAGGAALVYRCELVRQPPPPASGRVLLEHPIDLAGGDGWLMRCDRVDFDPNGVAPWHRHRGGGIRCLLQGRLEVTVGEGAPRSMAPGEAWFESGREPVLAVAAPRETSFVRFSILPAGIRGQSSILYVDPAAAAGGRPRRYTVYVDEPIAL